MKLYIKISAVAAAICILLGAAFAGSAGAVSLVKKLTVSNFETTVHKTNKALVVEVGTSWCTYCQKMKPHLEQIAAEKAKYVRVASADGDDKKLMALVSADVTVTAYPTLLFYRDGALLGKYVGFRDYDALNLLLEKYFGLSKTATEPLIEPATEPSTELITEPVTESVTESLTESVTEPKAQPTEKQKPSKSVKKPAKVTITSAKRSKTKLTLTYKKVKKADGYKIVYSSKKSFKGKRTVTITKTKFTLKKLSKKKTYYVKIRAFRKVASGKVYGAYSKTVRK